MIFKRLSAEKITFSGVELTVVPLVYYPREDSFLLARVVAELATGNVLDMGTGSGIQAIVSARKSEVASVTAVDASENALQCAEKNAEKNKVKNKIKFIHSNLFENVSGVFDTIIFNPPYLPVEKSEKLDEESMAWHGGADGRKILDPFLTQFSAFLSSSGQLLLLQSSLNNLEKTLEKLKVPGFKTSVVASESFFFEKIYVIQAVKK